MILSSSVIVFSSGPRWPGTCAASEACDATPCGNGCVERSDVCHVGQGTHCSRSWAAYRQALSDWWADHRTKISKQIVFFFAFAGALVYGPVRAIGIYRTVDRVSSSDDIAGLILDHMRRPRRRDLRKLSDLKRRNAVKKIKDKSVEYVRSFQRGWTFLLGIWGRLFGFGVVIPTIVAFGLVFSYEYAFGVAAPLISGVGEIDAGARVLFVFDQMMRGFFFDIVETLDLSWSRVELDHAFDPLTISILGYRIALSTFGPITVLFGFSIARALRIKRRALALPTQIAKDHLMKHIRKTHGITAAEIGEIESAIAKFEMGEERRTVVSSSIQLA